MEETTPKPGVSPRVNPTIKPAHRSRSAERRDFGEDGTRRVALKPPGVGGCTRILQLRMCSHLSPAGIRPGWTREDQVCSKRHLKQGCTIREMLFLALNPCQPMGPKMLCKIKLMHKLQARVAFSFMEMQLLRGWNRVKLEA